MLINRDRPQYFPTYQWEDGKLTHSASPYPSGDIDEADKDFICDASNSYLAKSLIGLMLPKLLDGPVFEPRSN